MTVNNHFEQQAQPGPVVRLSAMYQDGQTAPSSVDVELYGGPEHVSAHLSAFVAQIIAALAEVPLPKPPAVVDSPDVQCAPAAPEPAPFQPFTFHHGDVPLAQIVVPCCAEKGARR